MVNFVAYKLFKTTNENEKNLQNSIIGSYE